MKTIKSILKFFLGILVIYGLVGFLILPNIIKEQVVLNVEKVLKRKVTLGSVDVNPYTFKVGAHKFIIYGKQGERAFAGLRDLEINIDPLNLIKGQIDIKYIDVSFPFLTIHKNQEGVFNFADLLVSDEENLSKKSTTGSGLPNILVEKLSIRGGKINFLDETSSTPFSGSLKPINFNLRDFSTMKGHNNQLSFHVEIDDGATIDYRGKINSVEPLRLEGGLELHSGRLYTQWKYFRDSLGFIVADGALDASIDYTADLSAKPMQVNINNYKVKIDRLRLQNKKSKENILQLPLLSLEGDADLSKNQVNVDKFAIDGFSIKVRRDEKGQINWLNYFPAPEESQESNKSEAKNPWKIDIARVKMQTDQLLYEEHYVQEPFTAKVNHLAFGMHNIHIDAQNLNVSQFDTNVSEFSLTPMASTKQWLKFKTFTLDGNFNKSEDMNLNLNRIDLNQLGVYTLMDKKGVINFTRLSSKSASKPQTKGERTSPVLDWKINTIRVSDSNIDFEDRFNAAKGLIQLDRINLEVKDLYSRKLSWAKSSLSLRVNKRGKLALNSDIRHTPLKVRSSFKLTGLDLVHFQPYVDKRANLDINSGKLSLDFTAQVDEKTTKLIANTHLSDLNLSERREGKTFFAFSDLVIKDIDFSLNPDQMKISKVDIYNPYARMKIDENKTSNLSDLVPSETTPLKEKEKQKASQVKKPFAVFIGRVNFKDGKGEFSDLSLPLPFKTDIHDLNGNVIGLGNIADIKSKVELDGTVDEYGLAKISGQLLSANPKQFTDMNVEFQNIDMKNLSPYTGKFIGYKLKEGKMNVELDYKIKNSQMQGGNRVVLKRLTLGESVKSEDAISAPVGLAIALLKDGDGVIDLDVPVRGNVDEPDFAIAHVVWTAFKNLIVGVATAPFKFLGDMLGISAEELENVKFEAGKTKLLPPEREKLDKLSTALSSKKMLILKVAGRYDEQQDLVAMKTAMFNQEAINKLEDNTTDISQMDRDDLDDLLEEMYVEHFGKDKFSASKDAIYSQDIDFQAKKESLREQMRDELTQDQKVSQDDLQELGENRAKNIIAYLVGKGIETERFELLQSVKLGHVIEKNEYIPIKLELGAK